MESIQLPHGINSFDYNQIMNTFRIELPYAKIEVFGSRSPKSGKHPGEFSDLDILVSARATIPPHELRRLADKFTAMSLTFKVDLVDNASLVAAYRPQVEAEKYLLRDKISYRVFISYYRASHAAQVRTLASRLREDGIFAWIDDFDQHHPLAWQRWMELNVACADYVLVVCGEAASRAFKQNGPAPAGLGVNYEGRLITNYLYQQAGLNDRILPVLFDPADFQYIPPPLKDYSYFRLSGDDQFSAYPDDVASDIAYVHDYTKLYARLCLVPPIAVPDVGALKSIAPAALPTATPAIATNPATYSPAKAATPTAPVASSVVSAIAPSASASAKPSTLPSAAPISKANPYLATLPMPPERCVGRDRQLARIMGKITHNDASFNLYGLRRMGKSTLLLAIAARLQQLSRPCVLLDGQGQEMNGPLNLVAAINQSPLSHVHEQDAQKAAHLAADQLQAWCQEKLSATRHVPMVLIDEFDGIITQRGIFHDDFFVRLRGMISQHQLALFLATHRSIASLYQEIGRTSPFQNIVTAEQIGLLESGGLEALLAWGDGVLQPSDHDDIRRIAGQHPCLAQMLAGEYFDWRISGEADQQSVMDRFNGKADLLLRPIFQSLPDDEQQLLYQIAQGVPPHAGPVLTALRNHGLVLRPDNKLFGECLRTWLLEYAKRGRKDE